MSDTLHVDSGPKEACGLFGIFDHENASVITSMGLLAQQHRGEEAAGICSVDEGSLYSHSDLGEVSSVFTPEILERLPGSCAIGHNRYSVTGSSNIHNTQPLVAELARGQIAIAHNGNLVNAAGLRRKLELNGAIFQTSMDSEIILHQLAHSKKPTMKEAIIDSVKNINGSFSLLFLTKDAICAVRDPYGIRPLALARLDKSWIICSETSAVDLVGATYMGQVNPGEMVTISKSGIKREMIFDERPNASCIFEMIYFARPDSLVFGESVYRFRKALGRKLYQESPLEADMVVPVPDSGVYSALGYANAAGIPYEMAITRNHYVGRSFIQPSQKIRSMFARIKLNPIKNVISGKKIIIVDDSIVRGTTTLERVKILREVGAKEVHMKISCPPIKFPCYYGVDFPEASELIANRMDVEETARYLNLDSLTYLSPEGLLDVAASDKNRYCDACFSGNYPVDIKEYTGKKAMETR